MRTSLSRIRRMHQHNSLVWRQRRLSFWYRRSSNTLFHLTSTSTSLFVSGSARYSTMLLRHMSNTVEDVPKETSVHTTESSEEHKFRHGDHRWERNNLLTQRQFCALCWSGSSDDSVTSGTLLPSVDSYRRFSET